MNYEDISDFEVNKAVVKYLPVDWYWMDSTVYLDVDHTESFDPCNNPSDAWSIIVENNITIELSPDCTFEAYSRLNGVRVGIRFNKKSEALRAAMICFLKMKDAENKPCKKPLADGQWYKFCGEFDMDSAPALCVNCGGEFKLKDAEK